MKYIFQLIFLILIFSSCSNQPAVSPHYTPGWKMPVVEGIELLDETGISYGQYGNPSFPEDITGSGLESSQRAIPDVILGMKSGYPNPTVGLQTIPFYLGKKSKIKAWVTPARERRQSSAFPFGKNLVNVNGGKAITILMDGSTEIAPGFYQLSWDGAEYPQGFYRVYISTGEYTLWRDSFNYRCENQKNIPEIQGFIDCY